MEAALVAIGTMVTFSGQFYIKHSSVIKVIKLAVELPPIDLPQKRPEFHSIKSSTMVPKSSSAFTIHMIVPKIWYVDLSYKG